MRVDGISLKPLGIAPRPAAGAPGFADLLDQATAPAAGAAPAAALAAVVYEEADRQVSADRQARRHGRAMLQALGALQLAILGDGETSARSQLAALVAQAPAAHDPVLRLILREISLRAAVELARHSI
jgi:hypothetical protein